MHPAAAQQGISKTGEPTPRPGEPNQTTDEAVSTNLLGRPDRAGTVVREQVSSLIDVARAAATDTERKAVDLAEADRRDASAHAQRVLEAALAVERELTALQGFVGREADGLRGRIERTRLLSAGATSLPFSLGGDGPKESPALTTSDFDEDLRRVLSSGTAEHAPAGDAGPAPETEAATAEHVPEEPEPAPEDPPPEGPDSEEPEAAPEAAESEAETSGPEADDPQPRAAEAAVDTSDEADPLDEDTAERPAGVDEAPEVTEDTGEADDADATGGDLEVRGEHRGGGASDVISDVTPSSARSLTRGATQGRRQGHVPPSELATFLKSWPA